MSTVIKLRKEKDNNNLVWCKTNEHIKASETTLKCCGWFIIKKVTRVAEEGKPEIELWLRGDDVVTNCFMNGTKGKNICSFCRRSILYEENV